MPTPGPTASTRSASPTRTTIAAFVELGVPVNILLRPGAPPIARLAELGVARVSLGHFLHAEMLDALRARLAELQTSS